MSVRVPLVGTMASRDSLINGLFPKVEWPPPAQFPRLTDKKADRRSDFVVAALGITLGLICALFPWYIFFNQEQFGVQAIKFGGSGSNSGREGGGVATERSGPLTAKDVPNAAKNRRGEGAESDRVADVEAREAVIEAKEEAPRPGKRRAQEKR